MRRSHPDAGSGAPRRPRRSPADSWPGLSAHQGRLRDDRRGGRAERADRDGLQLEGPPVDRPHRTHVLFLGGAKRSGTERLKSHRGD